MWRSMAPSTRFYIERQISTFDCGLPDGCHYFVRDDFRSIYDSQGSRGTGSSDRSKLYKIEVSVAQQLERHLAHQCEVQQQNQKNVIKRARQISGKLEREAAIQKALNSPLPACGDMKKLRTSAAAPSSSASR
jgi:hypothetical protein